jgi:hypothetical protein
MSGLKLTGSVDRVQLFINIISEDKLIMETY